MTRIRATAGLFAGAAALAILPAEGASTSYGDFSINLNLDDSLYGYGEAPGADSKYVTMIKQAADYWESRITGYRTEELGQTITALDIYAYAVDLGGPGGTLAFAGAGGLTDRTTHGFATPQTGYLGFDTNDLPRLSDSKFFGVALHELAHAIGFGQSVWIQNGQAEGNTDITYGNTAGVPSVALDVYRQEFGLSGAGSIPLENNGGAGTAYTHWDEVLFGDHGGSSNPELMTGWIGDSWYVSDTTIASFEDVGYATVLGSALAVSDPMPDGETVLVNNAEAIGKTPVPASALLLFSGLAGLGILRRRKTR